MENIKEKNLNLKKEVIEWVESIIIAVVVIMFFFNFIAKIVNVSGQSMEPTLHNNDKLIVSNMFYTPKVGDVVIVSKTDNFDETIVKRIIATEGQTVDIDYDTSIVYVDGTAVREDYINEKIFFPPYDAVKLPMTIPENHVFVMGDNRNHSSDSRSQSIGLVDVRNIVGKVYFKIWPLNDIGVVK